MLSRTAVSLGSGSVRCASQVMKTSARRSLQGITGLRRPFTTGATQNDDGEDHGGKGVQQAGGDSSIATPGRGRGRGAAKSFGDAAARNRVVRGGFSSSFSAKSKQRANAPKAKKSRSPSETRSVSRIITPVRAAEKDLSIDTSALAQLGKVASELEDVGEDEIPLQAHAMRGAGRGTGAFADYFKDMGSSGSASPRGSRIAKQDIEYEQYPEVPYDEDYEEDVIEYEEEDNEQDNLLDGLELENIDESMFDDSDEGKEALNIYRSFMRQYDFEGLVMDRPNLEDDEEFQYSKKQLSRIRHNYARSQKTDFKEDVDLIGQFAQHWDKDLKESMVAKHLAEHFGGNPLWSKQKKGKFMMHLHHFLRDAASDYGKNALNERDEVKYVYEDPLQRKTKERDPELLERQMAQRMPDTWAYAGEDAEQKEK